MTKEEIDPTIHDLRKLSRYIIHHDIKLNCKDPITNAINIIALQGADLESKDKENTQLKQLCKEFAESLLLQAGQTNFCPECGEHFDGKNPIEHTESCTVILAEKFLKEK